MKKNRNLTGAILSLVIAIGFAVAAVVAYSNGYYILLFRVIPLNEITCGILAALLLIYAIFQLVWAPKKDREEVKAVQTVTQSMQEAATVATALVSPCTVTVAHAKGSLSTAYKFKVLLNGYQAGEIKNKEPLTFGTTIAENNLTLINQNNSQTINHAFTAVSGGQVNINITSSLTGGIDMVEV